MIPQPGAAPLYFPMEAVASPAASPAAWVLAGGLLIAMYYYIMNVHMKKMFGDYNQKV